MDITADKVALIVESLDNIADGVQAQGLAKEAEELDVIANTIEKMAKIIPREKIAPRLSSRLSIPR